MVREPGEVVPGVARRVEAEGLHRGDRRAGGVGRLQRGHRRQPGLVGRCLVRHRRARPRGGGDQGDQRLRGPAHRGVGEAGPVPDRVGHALHTLGRAHRDRGRRHHTVRTLRRDDLDLARRRVVERGGEPERVDDRGRLPHVVGPGAPPDVGPVAEPVDASHEVAVGVEVVGPAVVIGQLVGKRHLTGTRPPRQDARRARELEVLKLVVLQPAPARLVRVEQVRPARGRIHPLFAEDVDERATDAPARAPPGPVDRRRRPFLLPVELDRHVGGSVAVHGDDRHRDRELAGALVDLPTETTVQGERAAGCRRGGLRRGPGRGQRHTAGSGHRVAHSDVASTASATRAATAARTPAGRRRWGRTFTANLSSHI